MNFGAMIQGLVTGVQPLRIHRWDSNQCSDHRAILFFFNFKFNMIKVGNIKYAFSGELIFLPN